MLSDAMIIRTNKTLGSPAWPDVVVAIRTFHPPADFPQCLTAEDVQQHVHQTIRYKREDKDNWQTPYETIQRGTGDCEDHAILKIALLRFIGIRSYLVIVKMKRGDRGHALCAIEDPWCFLDCRHARIMEDDEVTEYDPLYILGLTGNRIVLRTVDRSA